MDSIERKRWKKRRKKGVYHFVIIRGGIGWGVSVGLLWNIARIVFSRDYYSQPSDFYYRGLFMILGFFVGGALLSLYEWNRSEKRYSDLEMEP